ncbi:hypothetical protein POPTR_003G015050v4 [Populus trichocarpa]|uniref:Uncharacterized protein n=1 Tax=Populus trichocarpa TaxID=3694 RepID=A0ACC0T6M3_POPTR|nr:hypothetical protein POPTR_003G015050v4 [Populus trichocarpa]
MVGWHCFRPLHHFCTLLIIIHFLHSPIPTSIFLLASLLKGILNYLSCNANRNFLDRILSSTAISELELDFVFGWEDSWGEPMETAISA